MFGFLNGPHGVYSGNYCIIDSAFMDQYRNLGGFDIIGSGRHKSTGRDELYCYIYFMERNNCIIFTYNCNIFYAICWTR
jgi:6-phosphofructokinase